MMVEMNLTKVHCKHIWKCYNEPPHTINIVTYKNALKMFLKRA
jgi:hypothetical protein